ncbi:predicted protein [Plenodomus lingam JN3]|uniref:Uncharacterized protein n=1 Tax=Leptosphaeria maculans (strain JN3 / isolate v23.1.3 / race Av1-4-5-6-7-8) TaxID=985895 RepID=E5A7E4_LEPMJ|nr:predicted protein [Plenodomus lingam JN3]CBX99539.1 predicted protein [Plenodomus lingam JN3]
MAGEMPNGHAPHAPIEVSFPLPKAPHTNLHLQLTNNGPNLLLFLTTATPESASSSPLGSFVYAMPNRAFTILASRVHEEVRANHSWQRATPTDTLSTPLFTHGGTLDFATRLSKVLARKTGKPVYVGNSASFASAGMGGTVEEEMEGFKRVVEVVMDCTHNTSAHATGESHIRAGKQCPNDGGRESRHTRELNTLLDILQSLLHVLYSKAEKLRISLQKHAIHTIYTSFSLSSTLLFASSDVFGLFNVALRPPVTLLEFLSPPDLDADSTSPTFSAFSRTSRDRTGFIEISFVASNHVSRVGRHGDVVVVGVIVLITLE